MNFECLKLRKEFVMDYIKEFPGIYLDRLKTTVNILNLLASVLTEV
jgi:hypothetical protein